MLTCLKCKSNQFVINREATYVYSYKLDNNDENLESTEAELNEYPYLFYNREILDSKDYIQCQSCGAHYPFTFGKDPKESKMTILQRAIRSDNIDNPEFLG
ncbi:MAG: hypothetical protein GX308_09795 [Epulopiscium sp.]|nr:hypothetical protein [Candidatus Epulonipiscium sp.]